MQQYQPQPVYEPPVQQYYEPEPQYQEPYEATEPIQEPFRPPYAPPERAFSAVVPPPKYAPKQYYEVDDNQPQSLMYDDEIEPFDDADDFEERMTKPVNPYQ